MKKIFAFTFLAVSLVACSTSQNQDALTPKIGSPNPASQYCVNQGGNLEIKDDASGQVGYCHLKDGSVFEEWSFFRSHNTCVSEKVSSLIGQQNLSDDDIRKLTQARQIRRLAPGQAMTMDFREDRVNVTIDPASKKIIHATCG